MTETESLADSRLFRGFLRVRQAPGASVTAGILRERWQTYARANNSPLSEVSHRVFGETLRAMGYTKVRRKAGWTYPGLRANSTREEVAARRARRAGEATT